MTILATTRQPIVVITEASSRAAELTAHAFARNGFQVVLGTRRVEWCWAVAEQVGGTALELDITSDESVQAFVQQLPRLTVLINSAGTDRGLASADTCSADDWRRAWHTNVLGTLRITRALLPRLIRSGTGIIVHSSSSMGTTAHAADEDDTVTHADQALLAMLRSELRGLPVHLLDAASIASDLPGSPLRADAGPSVADDIPETLVEWVRAHIAASAASVKDH